MKRNEITVMIGKSKVGKLLANMFDNRSMRCDVCVEYGYYFYVKDDGSGVIYKKLEEGEDPDAIEVFDEFDDFNWVDYMRASDSEFEYNPYEDTFESSEIVLYIDEIVDDLFYNAEEE